MRKAWKMNFLIERTEGVLEDLYVRRERSVIKKYIKEEVYEKFVSKGHGKRKR